jgi:hypothetical protein
MSGIDKRGKLEELPFTYQTTKDGKVFIHWHDRQIRILTGELAEKLKSPFHKQIHYKLSY